MTTACASLGLIDEALSHLDRYVALRHAVVAQIGVDPCLDPLRSDPRFAEILKKLGFDG